MQCNNAYMLNGFRDFILRGNAVDVVTGATFAALIAAFGNAFLNPLVKLVSGGGRSVERWAFRFLSAASSFHMACSSLP